MLPARPNRIVNLVVAAVYVPVTLFNTVGETWFVFYGPTIGLELAARRRAPHRVEVGSGAGRDDGLSVGDPSRGEADAPPSRSSA